MCSALLCFNPKKWLALLEQLSCLVSWFSILWFSRQCTCTGIANRHAIFRRPLAKNFHLFFSQSTEKKSQTSACQKPSGSALAGMQKHFPTDYFWRLFTASRKRVVKLYLNRRKLNYLSKTNFYQMAGDEKSFPVNTLYITLKIIRGTKTLNAHNTFVFSLLAL